MAGNNPYPTVLELSRCLDKISYPLQEFIPIHMSVIIHINSLESFSGCVAPRNNQSMVMWSHCRRSWSHSSHRARSSAINSLMLSLFNLVFKIEYNVHKLNEKVSSKDNKVRGLYKRIRTRMNMVFKMKNRRWIVNKVSCKKYNTPNLGFWFSVKNQCPIS